MVTEFTPEKSHFIPDDWQDRFLEALADSGNVSHSAGQANVSRTFVYRYYKAHPDFAALWEEAIKQSNVVLEDEARRRAVTGVERRRLVKAGDEWIEEVETRYSDTLLIFLMKGNMPEKYRENISLDARHDVTVNGRVEYVYELEDNGMQAEGDSDGSGTSG